jgi:hypothetical protein
MGPSHWRPSRWCAAVLTPKSRTWGLMVERFITPVRGAKGAGSSDQRRAPGRPPRAYRTLCHRMIDRSWGEGLAIFFAAREAALGPPLPTCCGAQGRQLSEVLRACRLGRPTKTRHVRPLIRPGSERPVLPDVAMTARSYCEVPLLEMIEL